MAQFHDLTVTDIHRTIRDAVVLTLAPADTGAFTFAPGQYLTFKRDFDGTELRRSYSICAGLDDGLLQVGIKRVDGGAFSSFANTELTVGDTLQAMAPMGKFGLPPNPQAANHYLLFAGGSGITPVLSIIRTTLAREPQSRCTLIYANKAPHTIMFRAELEDLKNTYMQRLNTIHILETDAQEIDLFTGLVTEEKCAQLFEHWIDLTSVNTAYICGPEPMMLGIAAALKAHGMAEDDIRFELFASGQPGRAPKRAATNAQGATQDTTAKIIIDGESRTIEMDKGTSVLDAARAQNVDAPYACKAGVCSTCRAKLTSGEVEMLANHALEDNEIADGYILTCQSYAITDEITVDYDAAGH